VALTAFLRMDSLDLVADPVLVRIMSVIILMAASAALGGGALAWLLSRSMGRPLRALEKAMARLRARDFSVRESVSAPDEIGSLTEGFNLMAERLSASCEALETRNRELTEALDHVAFLERVKRGLDRFVPDTVRRAIEENPDPPGLQKTPKDVTVLFLDIEGYTRLSEQLSREALTGLIERYFSLFLAAIRAEGGDINETAGDGLMILFQAGRPRGARGHGRSHGASHPRHDRRREPRRPGDGPADLREYRNQFRRMPRGIDSPSGSGEGTMDVYRHRPRDQSRGTARRPRDQWTDPPERGDRAARGRSFSPP